MRNSYGGLTIKQRGQLKRLDEPSELPKTKHSEGGPRPIIEGILQENFLYWRCECGAINQTTIFYIRDLSTMHKRRCDGCRRYYQIVCGNLTF